MKQRVISVIRPDNQQLALSLDAQTNLLTRYDYLYADPMTGDAVIAQRGQGRNQKRDHSTSPRERAAA
jgi:hypothetical protein